MLPSIRNRVRGYLYLSSVVMIVVLLLLFTLIQVLMARRQAVTNAEVMFEQISQVLEENDRELARVTVAFKNDTLQMADTVAYIIDRDAGLVDADNVAGSGEQLRDIAKLVGVDEINVFNSAGVLFVGTEPAYIGCTMDDGEQIGFFKPMLDDPRLRLCQDIMPNTADGKEMLYAAVWSDDYIVQVGMKPDTVNAVTERNDPSRIFSMLTVTKGVSAYAVYANGVIRGSTEEADVGLYCDDIGLPLARLTAGRERFSVTLHGQTRALCVVYRLQDGVIVYLEANGTLYHDVPIYCLIMFLALAVTDLLLIFVVHWYIRRHLIDCIDRVNASLTAIADGDLDENVRITDSQEFSELSRHINQMVKSILSNTDKISFVLKKANLNMGVYEYNKRMKQVRLTAGIGRLFGVEEAEMELLARNTTAFRHFVQGVCSHVLPGTENVYVVTDKEETRYVKIEEINLDGDVFGVAVDMTEAVQHRMQLEEERDIDLLTGLYNRRGAEARFTTLFADPAVMAHGALVMLDADELKIVNDRYGHDDGDRYLRKVADVLGQFPQEHRLAARVGGDEFVLLLYGYETEEELSVALRLLQKAQENTVVALHDGKKIPLRFSYGYQPTAPGADYNALLAAADTLMYENKRQRKEQWKNERSS